MDTAAFLANIIQDLRVELADEFDRNFERKAFFNTPWAATMIPNTRGSLMLRTGELRRSIQARNTTNSIEFYSSHPAASLHNEGGVLTVTPNMKRFFWAMFYKASGAVGKKKDGSSRKDQRSKVLTEQAMYYKRLALMKVGEKLSIPKRQFIGHHPQVDAIVKQVVDNNIATLADQIKVSIQKSWTR